MTGNIRLFVFIFLIFPLLGFTAGCDDQDGILGTVERETSQGKIIGQEYSQNGRESVRFLGIPYAKAPVGDLRFRPPQDPDEFENGQYEAFSYGSECPQLSLTGKFTGNEDCLFLNVWTPVDAEPGDDYPVMVFVHGGGNNMGSAAQTVREFLGMAKSAMGTDLTTYIDKITASLFDTPVYQGHYFADDHDVILVTINYRLGPLGHLAHPSVGKGSGNFTYLDIVKALEWVNKNIGDFGGDSGNVTLFGESAGSWNTCGIMNMPAAKGLFHKAIMESQSCLSRTLKQAEIYGRYYVKNAGCGDSEDVAKCLREADVKSFFKENIWIKPAGSMPFIPTVDGDIVPRHFSEAITTDEFNHVPTIVGNNENELALNIATDIGFNCPLEAELEIFGKYLRAPMYQYRFNHHPVAYWMPVIHAFELPYVFGTAAEMFNYAGRETAVADIVNAYWAGFAWTGNPNSSGRQFWPAYDNENRRYLRLNGSPAEDSGSIIFQDSNCLLSGNLLNAIMGYQIVFW